MNRRSFLGSLLAGAAGARAQGRRLPNIVFMFSDDHAYQAISAYGAGLNRTPNIDRIANEGMIFRDCVVTNSICAPCRATVLTGKYSHVNGVIDNTRWLDGRQPTVPKLLRGSGYQTALFGKWHLKSDPTGFDSWEVLPGQGNYYNPDFLTTQGRHRRDGYVTDIITDLSLDWLAKARQADKPFLLMCQHKAPHRNWMPAPEHLTRFDGVTFPEPDNLFDDYASRATPAHNQQMEIDRHMLLSGDLKVYPFPGPDAKSAGEAGFLAEYNRMDETQKRMWDAVYQKRVKEFATAKLSGRDLVRWKYQCYLRDYLGCIQSVDDSVGRILRYLDAADLARDTIVVYGSDQGFYLGEHGWFDKRWIYEESVKTPLLIRWPGVTPPGSSCDLMVSTVDYAGTFLNAAGLAVPQDMQGSSFVPILRGERPSGWRRSFYYHYYEDTVHHVARHYGVRTGRYTLAHYYDTGEWELFDRKSDPRQMRNVYGKPEYAQAERELKAELVRLRRELKVPEKDPDR